MMQKQIIFGDDFNINLHKKNIEVNDSIRSFLIMGCSQKINVSTRFSPDFKNSSLLDHIYTNLNDDRVKTNVLTCEITDHLPTLISITGTNSQGFRNRRILRHDLQNFDSTSFNNDLNQKFSFFYNSTNELIDAHSLWNKFENIFVETVNMHAPLRYMSRKQSKFHTKPWITKAIRKSIKTKNKLLKKLIKDKKTEFSVYFKTYRNLLTKVKEISKHLYFKQEIFNSKSNSKKLWSTINNIVCIKKPKNSGINCIENSDHDQIFNSKDIAESLNKYFISIPNKLLQSTNNLSHKDFNIKIKTVSNSIFINPFTEGSIKSQILNMKTSKAYSSDSPRIQFLQASAEIISPVIALIFNQCIKEGVFPDSLKIAEVVPIFKKGCKTNPNNYRPISLLSPFAKIFENHIYLNLNSFFNKNNVLHKLQYGFRKNSSTELAVTQIVDEIVKTIEKKSILCSIFLDLAKAFNTVNHEILLKKLNTYGIRGNALKLLSSFLVNRKQCTTVNGQKSNFSVVDSGVPQGSTLGPLLFLIYINDLPLHTNLRVRLFADDACLSFESDNAVLLEEKVNFELNKVNEWLNENKLFLNSSKSNFLIFTKKRLNHDFKINVGLENIRRTSSIKYLGVTLDENLTWEPHIRSIKSKVARNCYMLYKLKSYVDYSVLKIIYFSLVQPYLQYCLSSWGGAAQKHISKLFILQKLAVRSICNVGKREHSHSLFKHLGILKLNDIYNLQVGKMMHKTNHITQVGEHHMIQLKHIHSYNTRLSSTSNYYLNHIRTTLAHNSFSFKGPKLWQSIPVNLKQQSFASFKKSYKKYLLGQY